MVKEVGLDELLLRIDYDGSLLSSPEESMALSEKLIEVMSENECSDFIIKTNVPEYKSPIVNLLKFKTSYDLEHYLRKHKNEFFKDYCNKLIELCHYLNIKLPKADSQIGLYTLHLTKYQVKELNKSDLILWVRINFNYEMYEIK